MKKIGITLAALIVLTALWLGAAWYTGTRIQAQASDAIARINAAWARNQRAMGAQIKLIDYERGLLSSHARYAIASPLLGSQPVVEYDVTFWHGPFPLTTQGGLVPRQFQAHAEVLAASGPFKAVTGALMNGKPPLVVDIGCGYGHHCTGTGSVPPIDADLGPIAQNVKLAFGGARMRFTFDCPSDTDYKINGDTQLLPLTVGGQNFGSGQITFALNAQSIHEVFSWKTDQGESKLALDLTLTQPLPILGSAQPATSASLPQFIKTASINLSLSKPMIVDMAARALNLTKGADLASTRQEISAKLDPLLASNPAAQKYLRIQGDQLISDWQYAEGKLTINGQDDPDLLNQIQQGYQRQLRAQQQALQGADAAAAQSSDGAFAARPASAPDGVAAGQ
ncbi:MAG: YdgA family protein [Burkholderiaceae bacterium]|jgi:uncharacterized protein YdgA (DUF945 family)|nr:YdgA family protein [Burkholderiaceae bacterium]